MDGSALQELDLQAIRQVRHYWLRQASRSWQLTVCLRHFFLDILLKLNPVLKGQLFGSLTPRHATTKCVNDETDNRFPCIAMCMLLIGGWVDDGHALC